MRQINPHLLVSAEPEPLPDPVHYWPIEQGSGTILYDAAPINPVHCAFIDNNQVWASPVAPAPSTFSIRTNGTGKGARHAQSATLAGLTDKTISFWIKPRDMSGTFVYLSTQHLGAPVDGAFYVVSQNGSFALSIHQAGANRNIVSNPLGNTTTNHFITFVHEAGVGGAVYRNGVDDTYSDTSGIAVAADPGIHVDIAGDSTYGLYATTNEIDDLRVYDQAFTPEQVAALFQSYA